MSQWDRTLYLADLVRQWKAGELTIPELAEKVVKRIERNGWLSVTPYPDTLRDHLNQLKQATTSGEYVAAFDYIYDVADTDRVWIQTS